MTNENKSILIIGTIRSGTSTLATAFQRGANMIKHSEPWNRWLRPDSVYPSNYKFEDNSIVKVLIHDNPDGLDFSFKNNNIVHMLNFYENLIKQFDTVILLGRLNMEETLISYTYQLTEDMKDINRPTEYWQTPYTVSDTKKLPLDTYRDSIIEYNNLLKELSLHLDNPIVWYEDLYSGDISKVTKILNDWNNPIELDTLSEYVNPTLRLKKEKSTI